MKHLLLALSFSIPFLGFSQLTTSTSKTDITCFGDSNGTATVNAGVIGASEPLMISEVNPNTPDFIEITNVSGQSVNTDGWFVITSDDYSLINDVNALSWDLPTSVASNWVAYREDASGSYYWGNNLFYSSGNPGWVLLSDDQGNIIDFMAWGWPEATILNTFNVTFGSFTFDITTSDWTGAGVTSSCSNSFVRAGQEDNNDNTDWSCNTVSKGSMNSGLTTPFLGGVGLSFEWSTGDTTNTVTDLGPGIYYVTTTTTQGDSAIDTVTIIEPPVPSFTLPNDTIICSGGAIIIDAGGGWDTYTWSNGQVAQSFLLTQPGTYYCTVTDTNGCPASDSIVVGSGQTPSVDLGADTVICDTQYILNAGNPGSSYLWSTGEFTQSILITSTGTYVVTVTSQDGCSVNEDIYVQMFEPAVVDLGEDFSLCVNYGQTEFLNAGAGFASYTWSTGANSTTQLVGSGVTQAGTEIFWVEVATDDGCTDRDSIEVTYEICTGVEDLSSNSIEVYPNPTHDNVTISTLGGTMTGVSVLDLQGKLVLSEQASNPVQRVEIDLSSLSAGTYLLKVENEDQVVLTRLIKH